VADGSKVCVIGIGRRSAGRRRPRLGVNSAGPSAPLTPATARLIVLIRFVQYAPPFHRVDWLAPHRAPR